MRIVCLDLEGVLIPEVWINVAERTGIAELRLTTRDIPDYDVLMKRRLGILDQHGLGLPKIQEVIAGMEPLPGAKAFLDALRERYQVIILSDTFYEFAEPFMRKLGWPTLFCHSLEVEPTGRIAGYRLRQPDPKRKAVARAARARTSRSWPPATRTTTRRCSPRPTPGSCSAPPTTWSRDFPSFPHVETLRRAARQIDIAFDAAMPALRAELRVRIRHCAHCAQMATLHLHERVVSAAPKRAEVMPYARRCTLGGTWRVHRVS